MSEAPTVHTLHGPFTPQTTMLYRRIARRHWFVAISQSQRSMGPPNLRWAGMVHNGIPMDRYPVREGKTTTCSSSVGPTRRRRRTWPSRRPGWPGGGWSCVSPLELVERGYSSGQVIWFYRLDL